MDYESKYSQKYQIKPEKFIFEIYIGKVISNPIGEKQGHEKAELHQPL
jgi:hypothetical protein